MARGPNRPPRRLSLGRGYVVPVFLVPPATLAEMLDEEDWAPEDRSPGTWDVDGWAIYLRSDLPVAELWNTYWHEVAHAVIDIARIDARTARRAGAPR